MIKQIITQTCLETAYCVKVADTGLQHCTGRMFPQTDSPFEGISFGELDVDIL